MKKQFGIFCLYPGGSSANRPGWYVKHTLWFKEPVYGTANQARRFDDANAARTFAHTELNIDEFQFDILPVLRLP